MCQSPTYRLRQLPMPRSRQLRLLIRPHRHLLLLNRRLRQQLRFLRQQLRWRLHPLRHRLLRPRLLRLLSSQHLLRLPILHLHLHLLR